MSMPVSPSSGPSMGASNGRNTTKTNNSNHGMNRISVTGLCVVSFVAGSMWTTLSNMSAMQIETMVQQRLAEERLTLSTQKPPPSDKEPTMSIEYLLQQRQELASATQKPDTAGCSTGTNRFPNSVRKYAVGMSRIPKKNFTQAFDLGVPIGEVQRGHEDVIVLYKTHDALPKNVKEATTRSGVDIPTLSAKHATENCHAMHVVLTEDNSNHQCIALVPQYQSFHIQNWMRVPPETYLDNGAIVNDRPLNASLGLRMVTRGLKTNGMDEFTTPTDRHLRTHYGMLQTYLGALRDVIKKLKVLAAKVARNNTVVVMVSNHGQSELLINFVCSARSRNIDISHVLVFATDVETKDLAEGLGMTAYYDKKLFDHIPSQHAGIYGDIRFGECMMAKVYCVHLVNMLGYDLLFQDIDVVWYRDPVPFFQELTGHDMYFQEDGGHTLPYAPYSANSGFYFVRNNQKTRHFFSSLLMAGDLVRSIRSHQQVMTALMAEHSSLFGLRIKVIEKERHEFPSGFHFHLNPAFMKDMFKGKIHPYIFHMCWTDNKYNKLLFLRQMGEWYVKEDCIGATANNITGGSSTCCAAEPLISCHYRDKPSIIQCNDSPYIDNGKKPSFWGDNETTK